MEIVYYDLYTKESIFIDVPVNVFINQIYSLLINQLGEEKVKNSFLLDGKAALILQDVDLPDENVDVILFSTNDFDIFSALKASIKYLNYQSIIIENDSFKIKFFEKVIQFQFENTDYKTTEYSGILLKDKTMIYGYTD